MVLGGCELDGQDVVLGEAGCSLASAFRGGGRRALPGVEPHVRAN